MTHTIKSKPETLLTDMAKWLKENRPELLISAYNDLRSWMVGQMGRPMASRKDHSSMAPLPSSKLDK